MNAHTTHKVTAAERNFNRTIDGWKALGLKVNIEDRNDEVLGQRTTALVNARAYGTTVFISATLRKPTPGRRIGRYCPRTSLSFFSEVWHGAKGRKVNTSTAAWYLQKLAKEAADRDHDQFIRIA